MRILHVVSSRLLWGSEAGTALMIQTHSEWGHEMHLACRPNGQILPRVEQYLSGVIKLRMRGWFGLAAWRARAALVRYIRDNRIDIVHVHAPRDFIIGIPAARETGAASVCTVHRLGEDVYCGRADRIGVLSKAVRDDLVARGVDPGKVEVAYNGVVVPDLAPSRSEIREELSIPDDAGVVSMLSRLDENKGCDLFIEAAARLDGALFLLAGSGKPSFVRSLKSRVHELGLAERFVFLGRRSDPWRIMAGSDVVVVPSRLEAFGRSAAEAMALGIPVVGSDAGGIPEVVEHGVTGLISPSGDSAALAAAVAELLENAELRTRMGEAGRRRVQENFTIERVCSNYIAIYEDLLARRR